MTYVNLSNFVREMSEIQNCINIFIMDMSRINNSIINDSEIQPIYPQQSQNGGLSIVLYTCAKGQVAKEVSEQRFIQTVERCFEASHNFHTYLNQFIRDKGNSCITVKDFINNYQIPCNQLEIVSSSKLQDFHHIEIFSKETI